MPGCEAMGEYRAPKSHATSTTTGGSAWSTCGPTTPPGTTTKACRRRRSRRSSAPTPPGNGPPGRSAAWAVHRPGTRSCCATRCICWPPAGEARRRRARRQTPAGAARAAGDAGSSWPTTLDAVKTRYKELAKRHHPDANGGDRAAEERLKTSTWLMPRYARGWSPRPAWRRPGDPIRRPPALALARTGAGVRLSPGRHRTSGR